MDTDQSPFVAALAPHAWAVGLAGSEHLVELSDPALLSVHRTFQVDGSRMPIGGVVGRAWSAQFDLETSSASLAMRVAQAGFKRNLVRSLRALGGNQNLAWCVFTLTVDGVSDGSWVQTMVGGLTDHWAFGRGERGLPCCGAEPSDHDVWCACQVPQADAHADPVLEAWLPAIVCGQRLVRWSVAGWDFFALGGSLTPADQQSIEEEFSSMGGSVDALARAIAGRTDQTQPPYMVQALRFRGLDMASVPPWTGITEGGRGSTGWTSLELEGRSVRRGTLEMLDQDEHLRGIPYCYDRGEVRFVIVTDETDWAVDALRQLP